MQQPWTIGASFPAGQPTPPMSETVDMEPASIPVNPSAPPSYGFGGLPPSDVHRPLGAGHNRLSSLSDETGKLQIRTGAASAAGSRGEVFYSPTSHPASSRSAMSGHASPFYPSVADLHVSTAEELQPAQVSGPVVKVSRKNAWSKFMAYEACVRVCLRHLKDGSSKGFLEDDCTKLAGAFGLQDLFLRSAGGGDGSDSAETGVIWEDSDDHSSAMSMIPVAAPEPSMLLRVTPLQVKSAQASQAISAAKGHGRKASRCLSAFGGGGGYTSATDNLYINVRRASTPTVDDGAWTVIGPGMTVQDPRVLDVAGADLAAPGGGEELLVELHTCGEKLAEGALRSKHLWQVANQGPSFERAKEAGGHFSLWKALFGCGKALEGAVAPRARLGQTWVEVFGRDGRSFGHVMLGAWITNPEEPRRMAGIVDSAPASLQGVSVATQARSVQQFTTWQVYDLVLEAAQAGDSCGKGKLVVTGPWAWLLDKVAALYGIRPSYKSLAHLRWVIRPDVYEQRGACLSLLVEALAPLKAQQATGGLLTREVTLLTQILEVVETYVAQVFENYFAFYGRAAGAGNDEDCRGPAVLAPAVQLFALLKDASSPSDQAWLADRLRVAANRQYKNMVFAAENSAKMPSVGDGHHRRSANGGSMHGFEAAAAAAGQVGAATAYKQVEAICGSITGELQGDMQLQSSGLLPGFVNLPVLTAAEYCRELNGRLEEMLAQYPPSVPSDDAVDLLVVAGRLQRFMEGNKLVGPFAGPAVGGNRASVDHSAGGGGPAPTACYPMVLDAQRTFGAFVRRWFQSSQELLLSKVRMQANVSYVTPNAKQLSTQKPISPIVKDMQGRIEQELHRYERVVSYWPCFAPMLEQVTCAALRETIAAVCRQCGLVQSTKQSDSPRFHPSSYHDNPAYSPSASPSHHAYRFDTGLGSGAAAAAAGGGGGWGQPQNSPSAPPAPRGGGPGPLPLHETILLNSLAQLLTFIPKLDGVLGSWVRTQDGRLPGGGEGDELPVLGAQYAELVVELRTKYGGAVASTAERLSDSLFKGRGASPRAVLQHVGLSAAPTVVQQQVQPILECMDQVLAALSGQLEPRVFVGVGRGLWDFTAREVYEYVMSLRQQAKENKGAWRGKQSATAVLGCVDNFFRQAVTRTLGSSTSARDLDAPYNADRCHKLLADNTAQINMAYTVY